MSATEWIGASQVKRSRWGAQDGFGLGRQLRILDPGVGERLDDAAVERRVGRVVDDRALVLALEIDRVDRAQRDELRDQLLVPGRRGVELEAQARRDPQALAQRLERRRLAQAQRGDEAHRLALAPERRVQRRAGLAQREVERGRVERPVAVQARLRRSVGSGKRSSERRCSAKDASVQSPAQRPRARAGALQRLLVLGVVGDVLAEALLARAVQADDGGLAHELARQGDLVAFELVVPR